MKNLIMIGVMGSMLAACSSTKNVAVMDSPPPHSGVDKEVYEYKSKLANQQVKAMPEWYTKIPEDDEAIFAVGTAVSPDLQLSNDIAILLAKRTLADRINGELRSQTKSFVSKIGTDANASVLNEIETVTKNLIADVDVAGYRVKESDVVVNGTQYRVYVLLEYSSAEATKILMNRLKREKQLLSKISALNAFKELDEQVNEKKDEEKNELDTIINSIEG